MASLYLRGRVWWCAFRDWTGKRRAVSLGVRDKEAADALAKQLEGRHSAVRLGLADAESLEISSRGNRRIGPLVDSYIATIRNPSAAKDARTILNGLIQHAHIAAASTFGSRTIVGMVDKYLESVRARGVQRRRISEHLRGIRSFGQWLENNGYIITNEVARVKAPGGRDVRVIRHRALTPAELDRLAQTPLGAWYEFLAFTGLRAEEAIELERADLELGAAPTLRIREEVSKTDFEVILPLARRLAVRIANELDMKIGRVFVDVPTRPETRRAQLARDCVAAGVDAAQVNQRSFRMTFTTYVQNAQIDDAASAQLRRDYGRGSKRLRLVNYADQLQRMPALRNALARVEQWYEGQTRLTACATS